MQSRILPRASMISILILTLLLISTGIFLIYYTTVRHPAALRIEATATVKAMLTKDTQTTAIARVQATGTVQAQAHIVGTALAVATAQVQATAIAWQTLYAQDTSGTPTINSPLNTQNTENWDTYDTQQGGGCTFTNGALHSSIASKGYYLTCFAQNTYFSNFAMEITVTPTKGDEGGIVFRADDQADKAYMFRINHTGTYSLDLRTDSSHATALIYQKNPLITFVPGQSFTLGIVAQNNTIYLYINRQFVGSISDNTYSIGKIGVFASDNENPTDLAFSNIKVWKL